VHDTIELERHGVPATVIITSAFRQVAEFQFRAKGMNSHPYVELPHPVSNLKPDEMRAVSLRFVDELVRQLTS
jgi:hypothetical protein